jgi:hypothetical protein
MVNIDKKNDSIKMLPVGTKVWSIRQQEWGKVTKYENTTELYPISVMFDSRSTVRSFVADGRQLAQSELPELSLTEYNWLNGTGKFTPITDYKEEKQVPPIGTKVYNILEDYWTSIVEISFEYANAYPIRTYQGGWITLEGKVIESSKRPVYSLTEVDYVNGTGKFTPITEWESIN